MSASRIDKTLRGIAVLDSRFSLANVDEALSSYSEASQVPDQPVPAGRTFMQLEAPSIGSVGAITDLQVAACKEGVATQSDFSGAGTMRWKYATDSDEEWRGHLDHNVVTGFEFISYTTGGGAVLRNHSAIVLPDHRVLVAYGTTLYSRDPSTDAWSSVTAIEGTWVHSSVDGTALVRLDDGRLLLIWLDTITEAGTGYLVLPVAFSDDDGATWELGAWKVLPPTSGGIAMASATYSVRKIKAVYHHGFITLVAWLSTGGQETLYHWVSADFGASWRWVEECKPAASQVMAPDLVVSPDGTVYLFYVKVTTQDLYFAKKASPYSGFEEDPYFDTSDRLIISTSADVTEPECAAVLSEDGQIHLYWREASTSRFSVRRVRLRLPLDGVVIGTDLFADPYDLSSPGPVNTGDDDVYLYGMVGVAAKGRILLIQHHQAAQAPATNTEASLTCLYLGGWSSHAWRKQTWGMSGSSVIGQVYLPLDQPDNMGWTKAGAGTPAQSSDGLDIDFTGGASQAYYTREGPAGGSAGRVCVGWWTLRQRAGGSLSAANSAIRMRRADGTNDREIELRFSGTGYRMVDLNNASATVGSDASIPTLSTEQWDILVALELQGSTMYAYSFYKRPTESLWNEGPFGSLVNDTATPATRNHVVWGTIANSASRTVWRWHGAAIDEAQASVDVATGVTAVRRLQGKPFSVRPQWVDLGVQVLSRGGPAARGDTWTINLRGEYGLQNAMPEVSRSPAVAWRSGSDAVEQIIAWSPAGSGVSTRPRSSSLVVYCGGINWRTAYFEGYNGVGWTTLGTLDAAADGLARFARSGTWVRPDTAVSHGTTQYISMDELAGGYIEMDPAGTPYVRRIVANSEGVWRDDMTRRAELTIEGDLTGVGTSGTCYLRHPAVACVIHNATAAYQAYRLRIPAQDTAEGEHITGVIAVMALTVLGRQYARGRVIADVPNVQIDEDRRGGRRVTRRGPNRRRLEVAWPDAWPMAQIQASSPEPDYLSAHSSSAEAVGVRGDATILSGLLGGAQGGALPVLYLPVVPPASSGSVGSTSLVGREAMLWGTIVDAVERRQLLGEEQSSEVATLGSLRIEEEV